MSTTVNTNGWPLPLGHFDLEWWRDRFIEARNNRPVERSSTRRLLDHLPIGPFTTTELRVEVEQLDMSELSQTTQDTYRTAMRGFVRFIEQEVW